MFKTTSINGYFNITLENPLSPEDFRVVPKNNVIHLINDEVWDIKEADGNRHVALVKIKSPLIESILEDLKSKMKDQSRIKALEAEYFNKTFCEVRQPKYDYRGYKKEDRYKKDALELRKFKDKLKANDYISNHLNRAVQKINGVIERQNEQFKDEMLKVLTESSTYICDNNDIEVEGRDELENEIEELNKQINALKMRQEWANHKLYEKKKDAICNWLSEKKMIHEEALFEIVCEFRKTKYVNRRFPF